MSKNSKSKDNSPARMKRNDYEEELEKLQVKLCHLQQWVKQKGGGNKKAIRKLVTEGNVPGILAYADGQPVGWCAIGPREAYLRLANSRILKPVDAQAVWSITCFFVARPFRRLGVTVGLIESAVEFARQGGAKIVEGYPVEPNREQADVFVYTGLASAFRKAGFKEVLRHSPTRPIMRRVIKQVS